MKGTPGLARMQLVLNSAQATIFHKGYKITGRCAFLRSKDCSALVVGATCDQRSINATPSHSHATKCRFYNEWLMDEESSPRWKMGRVGVQKTLQVSRHVAVETIRVPAELRYNSHKK